MKAIAYIWLAFALSRPLILHAADAGKELESRINADSQVVLITAAPEENASSSTKLRVPLMNMPLSQHSVSRDMIEQRALQRIDEAVDSLAGVRRVNGFPGATGYYVRGFFEGYDLLRDGFRDINFGPSDLAGIECIDVLKGPASVLFGGILSAGGVIDLISRAPESTRSTEAHAAAGSNGYWRASIDSTGALNDSESLLYRAIVATEDSGDFRDDIYSRQWALAGPPVRPGRRISANRASGTARDPRGAGMSILPLGYRVVGGRKWSPPLFTGASAPALVRQISAQSRSSETHMPAVARPKLMAHTTRESEVRSRVDRMLSLLGASRHPVCYGFAVFARSGYASVVRLFTPRKWIVFVALMCQVLSATLVHIPAANASASTEEGGMHCADHVYAANAEGSVATAHVHTGAHTGDDSGDSHGCKPGYCKCPCAHPPALSMAAMTPRAQTPHPPVAIAYVPPSLPVHFTLFFRPPI